MLRTLSLRQRRDEVRSTRMKQFAFLFRQSRQLSEFEQKQRTTEVVAWVQRQISDGHKIEPRILGGENQVVDSEEKPASAASADNRSALVAINFLQAQDFGEAVRIARTHPGLR